VNADASLQLFNRHVLLLFARCHCIMGDFSERPDSNIAYISLTLHEASLAEVCTLWVLSMFRHFVASIHSVWLIAYFHALSVPTGCILFCCCIP